MNSSTLIELIYAFSYPSVTLQAQESPLGQIARGFAEGRTSSIKIALGILTLVLIIGGISGVVWLLTQYQRKKEKKLTILEAFQQNYKLSDGQEQYLEALIERFKNNYVHEPEVASGYLENFLEYIVKNLTHAPDQTLRRQVHEIPDLEPDEEILVILPRENTYRAVKSTVDRQKDRYLTLPARPQLIDLEPDEEDRVEICIQKGHLTYRGRGKIQAITSDEVIIHLPEGLHFEQQRVYTRVQVDNVEASLTLESGDGETFTARGLVQDLSVEGACLAIDAADSVERHQQGTVKFQLPGQDEIEARVEVVRANESSADCKLGLKFIHLELETREEIARFIKEHSE